MKSAKLKFEEDSNAHPAEVVPCGYPPMAWQIKYSLLPEPLKIQLQVFSFNGLSECNKGKVSPALDRLGKLFFEFQQEKILEHFV